MFTFFGELTGIFPIAYIIFMIIDLIRQHKKGKKVLKRFFIELGCGFAGMFVLLIATAISARNSPAPKLSPAAKLAKANWKKNRLNFSNGTFTINDKYRSERYEEDAAGDSKYIGGGVMFIGKFTNKSTKPQRVVDFMNQHITVKTWKNTDQYLELDPESYEVFYKGSKMSINRKDLTVAPHKTIKCAVNFNGQPHKDVPNHFTFAIQNNKGKKIWEANEYNPIKLKTQTWTYSLGE